MSPLTQMYLPLLRFIKKKPSHLWLKVGIGFIFDEYNRRNNLDAITFPCDNTCGGVVWITALPRKLSRICNKIPNERFQFYGMLLGWVTGIWRMVINFHKRAWLFHLMVLLTWLRNIIASERTNFGLKYFFYNNYNISPQLFHRFPTFYEQKART